MRNRSSSSLVWAAATIAIVLALLVGGGLTIRSLVASSFDASKTNRDLIAVARNALSGQLDEETGVRGYSATHERLYLEPFDRARATLPATIANLRDQLERMELPAAATAVDDAADANRTWLQEVAKPLTGERPDPDPSRTQLAGKLLVDRFRADIDASIVALYDRESRLEARARGAIDRIYILILLAAIVIVAFGIFFLDQQRRAGERIDAERRRAEGERRHAAELRAAYDAEKRIADSLQDAIAQRPLPTLPTLRFSATYVPATEDARVGGDWYDALELPNNRVLFAIGDVTGHGIEAAVTMNRARQALVTSALLEGDPASVLARVNDELFRQNAPLVTAVAGFADAGTYEFVYSTAGHPPPVLIEPGQAPRLLDFGSLPLGAMGGTDYKLFRVQSVPGATLVLYTDGAVEHSRNVIEGEELLIAAAASALDAKVDDVASHIHRTIFQGRAAGDDVAILTVGFAVDAQQPVRISADDAQSAFVGRLGRGGSVGGMRAARRLRRPERLAS